MFVLNKRLQILLLQLLVLFCVCVSPTTLNSYNTIIPTIFTNCSHQDAVLPCLAGRFSRILDRAVDRDVKLFDGFVLKRDSDAAIDLTSRQRSLGGFSSLKQSLSDFLDSHILHLDISEVRKSKDGGESGFGGYGKVGKKDRKYLYYALTAVTGVFGLSVPIILKVLALLAGKALLASKAALIIIGSIALKKIFQSDKGESSPVKVHTHTVPIDDHDRYFDTSGYQYSRFQ